jgi:hypothetical protein
MTKNADILVMVWCRRGFDRAKQVVRNELSTGRVRNSHEMMLTR